MFTSVASITTQNPGRYIKRLCKHFGHKVDATFSDSSGYVDFSPGTCQMKASDESLTFKITAGDKERLQTLQHVVSSHGDQFARDESFSWNWKLKKES